MLNPFALKKVWDAKGEFLGNHPEFFGLVRKTFGAELEIGTEVEIAKILSRKYPEKRFYTASANFTCGDMKKITLEKLRDCLKYGKHEVKLSDEEIAGARRSLDRMVNI